MWVEGNSDVPAVVTSSVAVINMHNYACCSVIMICSDVE